MQKRSGKVPRKVLFIHPEKPLGVVNYILGGIGVYQNGKYTAKVGQDNVNIGVVTIFRLANNSLLQVY